MDFTPGSRKKEKGGERGLHYTAALVAKWTENARECWQFRVLTTPGESRTQQTRGFLGPKACGERLFSEPWIIYTA